MYYILYFFLDNISSTCFRCYLHPSSGAQLQRTGKRILPIQERCQERKKEIKNIVPVVGLKLNIYVTKMYGTTNIKLFLHIWQILNVSTFGNMADIYAIVYSVHMQKICDLSASCSSLSSAHCSYLKCDWFLLQHTLSSIFNWEVNLPRPILVLLQNFFPSTCLTLWRRATHIWVVPLS
jgi:hypothetical protein